MVKSEEETSETERSRISEDSQKGSETQKLIFTCDIQFPLSKLTKNTER